MSFTTRQTHRMHASQTQVVGNTYTLGDARSPVAASADSPSLSTSPASSKTRDDMGDIWVEMGLRARRKDVRMRCAFQYSRGMEEACVKRVFLVREGLNRLPVEDGTIEVMFICVIII